jgi:hypothetical protein
MTIEHKLVVGLNDIQGVVFECCNQEQACTSRVRISPDKGRIPAHCPNCGVEWVRYPLASIELSGTPFTKFVDLLAEVRKQQVDSSQYPKFRILLEFDEPISP